MFISHPENEFSTSLHLTAQGCKSWRALELSNRLPWFIATIQWQEEGFKFERTVLVSWGIDLVELIEGPPACQVIGLQYMEPPSRFNAGQWRSLPIRSIWRSQDPDGDGTVSFIFSTAAGEEFSGTGRHPAPSTMSSRQLIAHMAAAIHVDEESMGRVA